MNEKQDRVYSRTPQDLEYKYGFGKSYAEMMGLIEDEQKSISELSGIVAEIRTNVSSIEIKVNDDSGQLASLTTALNGITARVKNAESGVAHALSITDSGIFITNDDDETFIDGGRIVANSITTDELSTNVINGIEVGKLLAQGKYEGSTGDFIRGNEIFASVFNIKPSAELNADGTVKKDENGKVVYASEGSLNLYGMYSSDENNELKEYKMLTISHYESSGIPYLHFSSGRSGIYAHFDFPKMVFTGSAEFDDASFTGKVDFTNADIAGLTAVFG